MKHEKGIWAVVEISGIISLVCFCDKGIKDDSFFWGQSLSWSVLNKKDKILKEYGKISRDALDKLELEYIKEFHPINVSEPKQSAGWLAPNGNFYACHSSGHDSLAKHLSAIWYDDIDNPVDRLEKEGWMRIYDDGMVICWDGFRDPFLKSTVEQKETMKKLSKVGDAKWNRKMRQYYMDEI
jgi:hypothetical protein